MSVGPKALSIMCAKFQVDRSRNQAHMLGSTISNNVLLFLPVPWLNRKSKLSCPRFSVALLIMYTKFQVDRSRTKRNTDGSTVGKNKIFFLPAPWLNRM